MMMRPIMGMQHRKNNVDLIKYITIEIRIEFLFCRKFKIEDE